MPGSMTISALAQSCNAFAKNVNLVGFGKWHARLREHDERTERTTQFGAKCKVHRLSKAEGLPCCVREEWECPMCFPDSARAPRGAARLSDPEWYGGMGDDLWQAIVALEDLFESESQPRDTSRDATSHRDVSRGAAGAAASAAAAPAGASARTTARAQGRPRQAVVEVPNYPPRADSRASALTTGASFDYEPLDPSGSSTTLQSSAAGPLSRSTAQAEVERLLSLMETERLRSELRLRDAVARVEQQFRVEIARVEQQSRAEIVRVQADVGRVQDLATSIRVDLERLVGDHRRMIWVVENPDHPRHKRHRTDGTDASGQRKT
jgi:hypothetical protein